MGKRSKRNKSKANHPRTEVQEWKPSPGYTYDLHNDKKETLVQIDKNLYKLVMIEKKMKDILKEKDYDKTPHVRFLNPIQQRTSLQQEIRNKESEAIHELAKQCSTTSDKVTSVKKAISLGKDVPKEIEKLLKEKEEAKKKGDEKKQREIRRQLRALDYKRYVKEE